MRERAAGIWESGRQAGRQGRRVFGCCGGKMFIRVSGKKQDGGRRGRQCSNGHRHAQCVMGGIEYRHCVSSSPDAGPQQVSTGSCCSIAAWLLHRQLRAAGQGPLTQNGTRWCHLPPVPPRGRSRCPGRGKGRSHPAAAHRWACCRWVRWRWAPLARRVRPPQRAQQVALAPGRPARLRSCSSAARCHCEAEESVKAGMVGGWARGVRRRNLQHARRQPAGEQVQGCGQRR